MNTRTPLQALSLIGLLTAQSCAGLSVGQDFQSGRNALQTGRSSEAVSFLARAAAEDPNYRLPYRIREGVLTYLGRAYYETGRDADARATLEKALAKDKDDHLASLYLGLTLVRMGERERGAKELQSGLRGIHELLDYLASDNFSGIFWDPNRMIRNDIKTALEQKTASPEMIAAAQRVGSLVDREIDIARINEGRFRYDPTVDN